MNYCEKFAALKEIQAGCSIEMKDFNCHLAFIVYALSPLVYVATNGDWELSHAIETDSGAEYAVLTYLRSADMCGPEQYDIPLAGLHGKAELAYRVFEMLMGIPQKDADGRYQHRDRYDAFMESMRRKLDRPPYMGNKGEAYREGVRAAMSKMHELYGEDTK